MPDSHGRERLVCESGIISAEGFHDAFFLAEQAGQDHLPGADGIREIKCPQLGHIPKEVTFLMGQPAQDVDGATVRRDETEDNLKKRGLSPPFGPRIAKKSP